MAYLQEEYEKNPDTFQIPKEKLQELINAQLNRREETYGQEGDEGEGEDQTEDDELTEEQRQQLMLMQ